MTGRRRPNSRKTPWLCGSNVDWLKTSQGMGILGLLGSARKSRLIRFHFRHHHRSLMEMFPEIVDVGTEKRDDKAAVAPDLPLQKEAIFLQGGTRFTIRCIGRMLGMQR